MVYLMIIIHLKGVKKMVQKHFYPVESLRTKEAIEEMKLIS